MPVLNVHLFGTPRIERDGIAVAVERRKSLALLAYLAVTRQPHGRDALATLLWPDSDSERARAGLRRALVDLNAALGKGWVAAEGDQIALRADAGLRVDVGRFHAALARVAAHSHPPHRLCDTCLADLTEAASIYTADFLAGFTLADAADFDEWQGFQTESLRLELGGALEKLATGLAGRQEYAAALPHARRWLALDPLHEPAHRLLMQLHAQAGDRAAALRQYDACGKVLQAELGIAPEPETTALAETIRRGAAGDPAPAFAGAFVAAPTHNLPPDPTPFIGREAELAQIAARLADPACRLLTILGPGGMGKTRLAIQAARGQTDVFAHGVFFVDLALVAAADFLPAAIVRALPIAPSGADAQAQLAGFLRDKHLLLVLDNFEHLVEGADLLPRLLAGAPKLKLLVTSRMRLNLREEWLAPLEGLELPAEDAHVITGSEVRDEVIPDLAQEIASLRPAKTMRDSARNDDELLEQYSATALFLACVRRLRPDFQPTAADAGHIVRICRLLDGIPLAIELAAARMRALPLEKIAVELERGIHLLTTTLRDVPQRHRSMTAAFDGSWGSLPPDQRAILRRSSVFRGGCTVEAAESVASATVSDLAELADASWLWLAANGRYEMHELTRQYCAEKLAGEHLTQTGETPDQVRDHHAAYYMALLKTQPQTVSTWQDRHLPLLPDLDNFSELWLRAIERSDFETLRRLLGLVSRMDASPHAALRMLEPALNKLTPLLKATDAGTTMAEAGIFLAELLCSQAMHYVTLGQLAHSEACLQDGMDLLARLPHAPGWIEAQFRSRFVQARCLHDCGDFAGAIQLRQTLLAELPQIHTQLWPYQPDRTLTYWQAELTGGLFHPLYRLGRYDEAERVTRQALQWFASMPWACNAFALANLGLLHYLKGEYDTAFRLAAESLRVNQAHGQQTFGLYSLLTMAQIAAAMGRSADARNHYRRAIAQAHAYDRPGVIARGMAGLAGLELDLGQPARATALYEEVLGFHKRNGLEWGDTLAVAWIGLGRAACALRDPTEAEECFVRALRCRGCFAVDTMTALAGLAQAQLIAGAKLGATELLAFVVAHPATSHRVREPMARLLAELEAELPAEQFAAAVARGRTRQVDDVVAEIIGEPARQPADAAAALI